MDLPGKSEDRGRVVSNASPLILLSKVGEFSRLQDLFGEVWIAGAIRQEVVLRGQGRPGSAEVDSAAFVVTKEVSGFALVEEFQRRYHLGSGEASTLVLAREVKADLVLLDDRAAREVARAAGLRIAGTLRILELAFERGMIHDLGDVYQKLKASSARISPEILEASLRKYR